MILQDLKELARELGAPAGGRKEELVSAILAAQGTPEAAAGAEELDDGLGDDIVDGAGAAGAAGGPAPATAAEGKHAAIVFALEKQQVWAVATVQAAPVPLAGSLDAVGSLLTLLCWALQAVEHKKANIVGIKTLSDSERAQLRAAK